MNYKEAKEISPEQVKAWGKELQQKINPKPPVEERERKLNERIAAREKKIIGPSETK